MVIGENPGTKRNQDWWADWNAKTGYDYDTFIADYKMKKTIKGVRLRFEHYGTKFALNASRPMFGRMKATKRNQEPQISKCFGY